MNHEHWSQCVEPKCEAQFKTDHWNTKKAQREGWFIQRDHTAWCPLHNPDWVVDWRARQARRSSAEKELS